MRLASAVVLLAAIGLANPVLAYDEEHEVTREKCPLPSGVGKVSTVRDQSCDKHGECDTQYIVTLTSPRKRELLSIDTHAAAPT